MAERSVGIVGLARTGADVAFTLAERDLCDIVLYDENSDTAALLATDLSDTTFGHEYNRRVSWAENLHGLLACDVVLVTDGFDPETATASTDTGNSVVQRIAETFVGSSTLFLVANEPNDIVTAELGFALHLPPSRVIGIGGIVDAHIARYSVGEALNVNPEFVRCQVIGPHDGSAQILWDFTSINGVPIRQITSPEQLAELEEHFSSQDSAGAISEASSRYTPAAACLEVLRALVKDDRRVLPVTIRWQGHYGINDVAMSVPTVVGSLGAERPVLPELDDTAVHVLKRGAGKLASALGRGGV